MMRDEQGEFDLIRKLAGRLPPPRRAVKGVGDDSAVLPDRRGQPRYTFTCDMSVEEVHFRREFSTPADIGWKCLAVNASDAGAMGADPRYALVALAVPATWDAAMLSDLYDGLAAAAVKWEIDIVGGDTTRSPGPLVIDISLIGELAVAPVLRSGAVPGDLIMVTGCLGAAAAGLQLLRSGRGDAAAGEHPSLRAALQAYRRPEPPVAAAVALAGTGLATAMMDISDGLAGDLGHLMAASGVGALIEAGRLPVAAAAGEAAALLGKDASAWALHGGEDYELLFTIHPRHYERVQEVLAAAGAEAAAVGRITQGSDAQMVDAGGKKKPLAVRGYDHFKKLRG